jgi:NAD(P)-dependent dehydrogenase (short-subunit alcohol dehydrogenase family)
MGDLDALQNLVTRTTERFGRLDILVNNAATALREDLGHYTLDAYNKSMDVNLRGPVFLVQEALPYLERSPSASIINVLSAGAFLFASFQATYAAAKAAMYSFTRAWAAEFASRGIRVNALAPGTVDTDMVRNNPPEVQKTMAGASLQRRAAHPDEMIGPALFLASDASSFVTGQVLIADGGLVPH